MPPANGPLPSLTSLFTRSWEMYKTRFWTLLGTGALPMLGFATLGGIILSSVFVNMSSFITPVILVGSIAWYVTLFWGQVAIIHVLKNNSGIVDAYKGSYKLILPYFWVTLIGMLAVYGGYFLFIIPGIVISLWLYVAMIAVGVGDARGLGSLALARDILRGRWWATFGRSAALVAVCAVAVGGISSIARMLGGIELYAGAIGLMAIVLMPLGITYGYVLYADLKQTHVPSGKDPRNTKIALVALAIFGIVAYAALVFISIFLTGIDGPLTGVQ